MTDRVTLFARVPDAVPNTASFSGDFMLSVRFRRETLAEVEAIAHAMLKLFPKEIYFIDRNVARVRLKPAPKQGGEA